jgi:hypothetical protein
MAPTQLPPPHLEEREMPEAYTPLSSLVPVAQRSRKRPRTESGSSIDGSSCLPLKPGRVSSSQTRNRPRQSIQRKAPPGARHSPPLPQRPAGRPLGGRGASRPQTPRSRVNAVGLLLRTVDPSLVEDPSLSGDTSLSLAHVVQCLRHMKELASSWHTHGSGNPLPWQEIFPLLYLSSGSGGDVATTTAKSATRERGAAP